MHTGTFVWTFDNDQVYFLSDVSITLLDKTDLSNSLKREKYNISAEWT